jgi:hypothetical protein
MELLQTVKTFLRMTGDEEDALLELLIEETVQRILNFCNLNKMPFELRFTAARMVAELYTEGMKLSALDDPNSATVSNVSEGGRSVAFSMSDRLKAMTRSIEDKISLTTELSRFKRLFKLPPEEEG